MKIFILSDFYSNYSGNFIPSLLAFKKKAVALGHCVEFGFSNQNMSPEFLNWEKPFEKNNKVVLFDFRVDSFVTDVVNYIKQNHIDLVYYHFGSSIKLSQIKRKCPKSILFYQHIHNSMYEKKNFYAFLKKMRNYFFLDKKIIKICCSRSIEASAKYIFPKSKIYSVPNSIDFSRLMPSSNNHCGEFSILLFGHNYYIKGVDVAISAVNELAKNHDVRLDIVMGDRLEKNTRIIKDTFGGLPSNIKILPPTQDVVGLYKTHQIFLNASKEEGMSYANIEAYYCGASFIASDIPQNKEPNLPNTIYFKQGNYKDLVRALLLANSEADNHFNDVEYVQSNFSLDAWAEKILSIMNLF